MYTNTTPTIMNSSEKMFVSFVIPAYNEEAVLGDCLTSIQKQVAGRSDVEIVVVNNASTDTTKQVAESFGVRVVDETRKGLVWARKAGFDATTGRLVANIDADVVIPDDWFEKLEYYFKKNPNLSALSGPHIYRDMSFFSRICTRLFYIIGYVFDRISYYLFNKGAMLQGGNFVTTRQAIIDIGGYDTSITFYGEDTDIGSRISKIGKVLWTFNFPVYASSRRMKGEGVLLMGLKYAKNHIATTFFGKPATMEYIDIRPGKESK